MTERGYIDLDSPLSAASMEGNVLTVCTDGDTRVLKLRPQFKELGGLPGEVYAVSTLPERYARREGSVKVLPLSDEDSAPVERSSEFLRELLCGDYIRRSLQREDTFYRNN
jgi:hypothetical protein